MRFLVLFLVMAGLQGPVQAFNPIKAVVSLPFKAVKLTTKLAVGVVKVPAKLAYKTSKTTVKTSAADKLAAFAIKNAPYKDLAALAL